MEASEFGYCHHQAAPPSSSSKPDTGHFIVDDLLDFPNDDDCAPNNDDNLTGGSASASNSTHDSSSVLTPVDTCNSSSFSGAAHPNDLNFPPSSDFIGSRSSFSGDLSVPYDQLAELEWLSNFVEESFSSEDLQKLQLISGMSAMKAHPEPNSGSEARYYQPEPSLADGSNNSSNAPSPVFSPEMPVPGKARSKRSRTAPGNWASRLLLLSPASNAFCPTPHEPGMKAAKPAKAASKKKGGGAGLGHDTAEGGEVRRCLHCATDKTPQWRTGPMGPKTLCNACGVRYKSGRLVPEYRPAASPTFVLTKHSNSHRKVMELRRQKEMMSQQQMQHHQLGHQQQQLIQHPNSGSVMFDPPNNDDYLIHQHIGPDFRQLI